MSGAGSMTVNFGNALDAPRNNWHYDEFGELEGDPALLREETAA